MSIYVFTVSLISLMFGRRNIMAATARHTLYKTRLTKHVHAEQTKQYLNRNIQTQEKQNTSIGSFMTFYPN